MQWAAFDVDFPVAQDVPINVTYIITPTGNFPKARFGYVLETGAGWRDTIGSADVIVRLPYAASEENVLFGEGETSPGSQLVDNEIRWHWNELEPTTHDNIAASMLVPHVWQTILQAREAVAARPNDAGALAQLALAYESAITTRYPTDEHDPFAALSEQTFAHAVAQQPGSATLHANFAALLLQHLSVQANLPPDDPTIRRILTEVSTALALDPQNAQAQDVYEELQQSVEGGSLPLVTPQISAPTPTAVSSAVPTVAIAPSHTPLAQATIVVSSIAAVVLQASATTPSVPQAIATPAQPQSTSTRINLLTLGAGAGLLILIVAIAVVALRRR